MKKNQSLLTTLSIGVAVGAGVGLLAGYFLRDKKALSPENVLNQMKTAFKKSGPIEGSWIESEKKPFFTGEIEQKVYYGGFTRKEQNEMVQYEFVADAMTGALLRLEKIDNI